MKYLKSTSSRSYVYDGKVIPSNTETKWLLVDNSLYEKWEKTPVIKSLVRNGHILVSSKEPSEMASSTGQLVNTATALKAENAKLKAQVTKLQEEAKNLLSESDSAAAMQALRDELAKVQEENKKLTDDYKALEKEAKEQIAQLQSQTQGQQA